MYAVNDTGTIYNALRKFGTLEFVHCIGVSVVNGVCCNEVRLYFTCSRILFLDIYSFVSAELTFFKSRSRNSFA